MHLRASLAEPEHNFSNKPTNVYPYLLEPEHTLRIFYCVSCSPLVIHSRELLHTLPTRDISGLKRACGHSLHLGFHQHLPQSFLIRIIFISSSRTKVGVHVMGSTRDIVCNQVVLSAMISPIFLPN